MTTVSTPGAQVASNNTPQYKSTAPSWLFGIFGAFFQARNAKKRGLTDTGRYWKAAAISTIGGMVLTVLSIVAMALFFVAATGSTTSSTSADTNTPPVSSTQAPTPEPVSTGPVSAATPPAPVGIPANGVVDTTPCQSQVSPALNAKATLTNAEAEQVLRQLIEKVRTEVASFNRTSCAAYLWGKGTPNFKRDISFAASPGYTYSITLIDYDPQHKGLNTSPGASYAGRTLQFNESGSGTGDFEHLYTRLIKRDGHWSLAYADTTPQG